MNWLLYILAIMIFYDFSLHVFDLLIVFKKTKKKHPLGLYLLLDYLAKENDQKRKEIYQIFWTAYWGVAFLIFLVYFFTK